MRYKHLDLNLLVALDALLSERNVSRAAEKIHLTQPAMSNALSRLREYFGDELLIKTGQRMTLTPKSEYLSKPVRELLVRIDSEIMTLVDVGPFQARRSITEPTPPFKPCVRISRTRLTSGPSARSITQFSRCQEVCPGSGSFRAGDVIPGFRSSRDPSVGPGPLASCAQRA